MEDAAVIQEIEDVIELPEVQDAEPFFAADFIPGLEDMPLKPKKAA
jgi:hypothetical protein